MRGFCLQGVPAEYAARSQHVVDEQTAGSGHRRLVTRAVQRTRARLRVVKQ